MLNHRAHFVRLRIPKLAAISILALVTYALSLCAPSGITPVTTDNKNTNNPDLSLAVSFTQHDFWISNLDDVEDDLGDGVPEQVYLKFFKEEFPGAVKKHSSFEKVTFLDLRTDSNFVVQHYLGLKDSVSIRQPKDGYKVPVGGDSVRFILFIENMKIMIRRSTPGKLLNPFDRFPVTTGGSSQALLQKAVFLIWDNSSGKPISHGEIEATDDFMFSLGKGNWKGNIGNIAEEIFEKTDFKR